MFQLCEMKLLLVIGSLLTVLRAQEPSLSCIYDNVSLSTYRCLLTINNPDGFNEFTEIDGTHMTGFTNAEVDWIRCVYGSNTANVPQIICDTFPNIKRFDLTRTGIIEIDDSAFSGCSRIEYLELGVNKITAIPENAFVNLLNVGSITLQSNLLTTLPVNLFANLPKLEKLNLSDNLFENFPTGLFAAISNLKTLVWAGNGIVLSADTFAGMDSLRDLFLEDNGISEIPPGTFAGLTNLRFLELLGNAFTKLPADSFPDLGQLTTLYLNRNDLVEINDNAFRGLGRLSLLTLTSCSIRELNPNSFQGLTSLNRLFLGRNEIEDIPPETFASLPNIGSIALTSNRLMKLRRNSFGSLTSLKWLSLDENIFNALDREIIDDAVNLETLHFASNLCANNNFVDFRNNRAQYLPMLESCFANMRSVVDATTEGDTVYSFFEAPPSSGIVLRVQADNEVQIVLAAINFMWLPLIEIFIGASNNTQSVIRIDQVTDAVTVATPNIIQPDRWNDFRVTWADRQGRI